VKRLACTVSGRRAARFGTMMRGDLSTLPGIARAIIDHFHKTLAESMW